MKKFINAILDQTYTLLGMFVAWVVLEGSARTIVTYAIGVAMVVDATRQTLKKDNDGDI
jgi:pyruvate/2-oxoglutarate/acetoin dehydrogenase E1 component